VPLARRLLRESVLGLALGVAGAVFSSALLTVIRSTVYVPRFALVTGVAMLVTVLAGSTLAEAALRRSAAGKRVSGTGLTVVAMLVGAVVYLALAYWAGVALVPEA
jgi:hypothetical protein